MSLDAKIKEKVHIFKDITGGVNFNDPAMSIEKNQCADTLNARFTQMGFKRHNGAENLTTKAACDDYLRGLFHHVALDDTNYLYTVYGGKIYSINKTTGAQTEVYDVTGQGECWGASAFGSFFAANSTGVFKAEGTTGYRLGIVAPTGVTAAAVTSGGSLADGTYKLYASYARRVGGLDVLYSKGQLIADVVMSGGSGSGKITISNFANSGDAQVGNKVIWMTDPDDSTWYLWDSTGDNTTTTWDITSATPENNAVTYGAYAANNDLPPALEYLFYFNRRLWGIVDNVVYYSLKGYSKYDLERFPAANKITYPHKGNGLFSCGGHLCFNTVENGVIIQPQGNVSAKYEHFEQKTSFLYMRTVGDWSGDKIGLTRDRVGIFRAATLTFEPFDYGYNIRPVLERIWGDNDINHYPCGQVYRIENRIEYLLSLMDPDVNETNNNRTFILNLSRTLYLNVDEFKTPWEILGRGFNYVCVDTGNTLFMGQSFNSSSTIYKELSTHSTEVGVYGDDGTYKDDAEDMECFVAFRTMRENMFTSVELMNIRGLHQLTKTSQIVSQIVDDGSSFSEETNQSAYGQSLWGIMDWGDNWATKSLRQYEYKADDGYNGYTWNIKFSQVADDIDMEVAEIDVLVSNETGREI